MRYIVVKIRVAFYLLLVAFISFANTTMASPGPWYTGPLLAPSGHTIPAGHQNFEFYLFWTDNIGFYNNRWHLIHETQSHTVSPTLIVTQGLTKFMDIQVSLPYDFNSKKGQHSSNIGDTSLILGFQLLHDTPKTIIPDLRFTIQEAFPTGRYENLNPSKLGTDSTGSGSYQTGFGLNFQKLARIFGGHFLRTRLSLVYTIPASTTIRNFNTYGGGFGTNGQIKPGNKFSTDLAFEYSFSQHWVFATDLLYVTVKKTTFSGTAGVTNTGTIPMIGGPVSQQLSLAPALEYNFNSHLGIIAGVWFSIDGRNVHDFTSGVIAINFYN